jgi:cold shock CspA family protein
VISAHDIKTTLKVGDEHEGRVAAWHDRYGFVKIAGHAGDLFVSARNVLNANRLLCGDRVRVEIRMDGEGRLFGDNVQLVTGEPIATATKSAWQNDSDPNGVAFDSLVRPESFGATPWEDA